MAQAQSGSTVTVACKLPHGLLLRIFDQIETQEPLFGGGYRTVKIARERSEQMLVRGCAFPQEKGPRSPLHGGYALTPDVPEDLWNRWLEQNKSHPAVRKGLIFAHAKADFAEGKAAERAEVKSGLERIDPNKPGEKLQPLNKD